MQPYQIVGELKRFDWRNSAFARRKAGPGSAASTPRAKARRVAAPEAKPEHPAEDQALHVAARAPDSLLRSQWPKPAELTDRQAADNRYQPQDWAEFTRRVKDAAAFCGASLVGVTRANPLWLYACEDEPTCNLLARLETAIVMAIEMDYDLLRTSPAVTAAAATGRAYSQMAFTATCLAGYLSELGWLALPSGNDTALSIPLAVDAGLGELGRNGSLVTDEPSCFGVQEFCEACAKCVEACPARAIPDGERTACGPSPANNPGVLKWYTDPEECLAFWQVNGTSCASCIAACPLNKPPRIGK
jgi:ferredoxin